MIEGMKTGLFNVVAHPDRFFRRCKKWTAEMRDISNELIATVAQNNVILEKNLASYEKLVEKSNYVYWRNEFWNLVDQYNCVTSKPVNTIIGFDANSTDQMIKRMDYVKLIK